MSTRLFKLRSLLATLRQRAEGQEIVRPKTSESGRAAMFLERSLTKMSPTRARLPSLLRVNHPRKRDHEAAPSNSKAGRRAATSRYGSLLRACVMGEAMRQQEQVMKPP
jgi:hypothetical protein